MASLKKKNIKGRRVFKITRPYKPKRKKGRLIPNPPPAVPARRPVATNEPPKKPNVTTGLAPKPKAAAAVPAPKPKAGVVVPAPAPAPVKPDYDSMSYRELQAEAKKNSMKGVGVKKVDLLAQLKAL